MCIAEIATLAIINKSHNSKTVKPTEMADPFLIAYHISTNKCFQHLRKGQMYSSRGAVVTAQNFV